MKPRICADDISIVSMVGRRQVCGWHFAIDCLTNKEPPSRIARVPPPPLLSLFLLRSSLLIKNGASLPQLFLPFLFSINELLRQTISSRFIETSEKETTLSPWTRKTLSKTFGRRRRRGRKKNGDNDIGPVNSW